jgi:hypothetical protein
MVASRVREQEAVWIPPFCRILPFPALITGFSSGAAARASITARQTRTKRTTPSPVHPIKSSARDLAPAVGSPSAGRRANQSTNNATVNALTRDASPQVTRDGRITAAIRSLRMDDASRVIPHAALPYSSSYTVLRRD